MCIRDRQGAKTGMSVDIGVFLTLCLAKKVRDILEVLKGSFGGVW